MSESIIKYAAYKTRATGEDLLVTQRVIFRNVGEETPLDKNVRLDEGREQAAIKLRKRFKHLVFLGWFDGHMELSNGLNDVIVKKLDCCGGKS